jgi:ABC transport system ATP-binding/permease protein
VTTRSGVESFREGTDVVIGRDAGLSVIVSHDKVSRRHLSIAYEPGTGWVATDGSSNGTFRDGTRIGRFVVKGAVALMLGNPVDGEPVELAVGVAPPGVDKPIHPDLGLFSMVYEPSKRTIIGRAPDNDIIVNDLLASRHHAMLASDGAGNWFIEDLSSFNGTYVNGVRVHRRAQVTDGAVIAIAHHLFLLSGGRLSEYLDDGRINLTALGLTVTAGSQRLLDEVSFSLERNSLLAILGPTGAGKSTIMRALTGAQAPSAGTVLYNGRNLYTAYDELRYRIGYVPQDDILHGQLSVRRALSYAAKLRFPPDVTDAERDHRVDEVMAELGLTSRADLAVHKLSGGQRKRTSVALELLTRPSLLALDEPTSGLDPGYERQVMRLLRELSQAGRTVITVTHNTESLDLADRLLFLAPGGQLAYYGPPGEARKHFGTEHYPEVFTALEEGQRGAAKRAYASSAAAKTYLEEPLRRQLETAPLLIPPESGGSAAARVPSPIRQLRTLTRRYTDIIVSDVRNTLLLGVQAPILGLLMLLAFGHNSLHAGPSADNGGTVLLAIVLGATYLGAGNAVREIVKERAILVRERAAGLSPGAYLWSKVIVLGALTIIQAAILVLLGTADQGGPAHGALVASGRLELIVVASVTGLAAMALGLMISALVSNPDKALTILPVILLAQFLLSGAFFNVGNSVVLKPVGYVTSAHWGFAAAASTADLQVLAPHTCGGPAAPHVLKSSAADPACDSFRKHTAGTWLFDIWMTLLLTLIPLFVGWLLVRRIGVPRR